MKKIYKSLFLTALTLPLFTSCIEELQPNQVVTEGMLQASPAAAEALTWAMPAFMNKYATVSSSNHYDWGYGSQMHIRDVMTGDMAVISSGYDWYTNWEENTFQGEAYKYCQFIWNYYNQAVLTTNNTIGAINEENATTEQLGYLALASAYRANHYLDMARMYEFLPNDKVSPINADGNDVLGLTVPILTDQTTETEATDNPRVPRQQMFDFIISDLDRALKYVDNIDLGKAFPSKAVVYGLYARAYMWVEDYPQAANYARQAISNFAGSPTTKEQWLNTTTGFNSLNTPSWMWGVKADKEDDVVQSGILNWTSWMSNEAQFGYAAAEPFTMIDASMYARMSDDDFRKLSYIAPSGSPLSGQEPVIDPEWASELTTYASLKFRPAEGNGIDYTVGAASAYPLMRIEEMYFIEAEATAHSNPAQGKQLLQDFMTQYRYPTYTTTASSQDDIIEEIVFQKRVELWGEGLTFFDIKRLNYSVTRGYTGTNFSETTSFNTDGRPAWMNIVIVQTEQNNNAGVRGMNNPDPSDVYEPWRSSSN